MKVKGILVEGNDGETYLLGIGPRSGGKQRERPTIWRVSGAHFDSLEETRTASSTIRDRFNLNGLEPGMTHDDHVKHAMIEAFSRALRKFFEKVRW